MEKSTPARGAVTVRMAAIAVCRVGEDEAELLQQAGSGIVSAVGPDTPDWLIGERVILTVARPCDTTAAVAYQTHPACSLRKVPACLPLERACIAALGMLAGKPGPTVIVIGGDAIGQLAVDFAARAGARHVIVAEPVPARHAALLAAGATQLCDTIAAAGSLARELTGGAGADAAAITCATLSSSTLDQVIGCVNEGGTVVCACLGDGELAVFGLTSPRRSIYGVVTGAFSPHWDLLRGVQMHAGDTFKLDQLSATRWAPERFGEACAALLSGPNRAALIVFE